MAHELDASRIAEAMDDGKGFWRSCSGCHELNEGHPTGQYSKTFKCHLGVGCHECGGIGAIWDTTDYEDMGAYLSAAKSEPVAVKALEWAKMDNGTEWANSALGQYHALPKTAATPAGWLLRNGSTHYVNGDIEDAKAAAEADHESRIRSDLASEPANG